MTDDIGLKRAFQVGSAHGCVVTFYVDDTSISGARAREVIEPIVAVLARHGLRVGRDKTKVMPAHSAQTITGQTINCGRPSVSRRKRDYVRELIHELKLRTPGAPLPHSHETRVVETRERLGGSSNFS